MPVAVASQPTNQLPPPPPPPPLAPTCGPRLDLHCPSTHQLAGPECFNLISSWTSLSLHAFSDIFTKNTWGLLAHQLRVEVSVGLLAHQLRVEQCSREGDWEGQLKAWAKAGGFYRIKLFIYFKFENYFKWPCITKMATRITLLVLRCFHSSQTPASPHNGTSSALPSPSPSPPAHPP